MIEFAAATVESASMRSAPTIAWSISTATPAC
jgi:hypothetical protein